MYNWRKMTESQRSDVMARRRQNRYPWHSPPHRGSESSQYFVTVACYEHLAIIGESAERLAEFEESLPALLEDLTTSIYAWAILPNHYHVLIKTVTILDVLREIGRHHGRTSYKWNGEDNARGRKVWCNALETAIKSERHFWATMNYIHNNPVHHKYVTRWQDWPFCSATLYLEAVGRDEARRRWTGYPVLDLGKAWDPPNL